MAANPQTNCGNLIVEVEDLLRHDNVASLIPTWLTMAFNDLVQRTTSDLFLQTEVVTITTGTNSATIGGSSDAEYLSDPVCAVAVNANTVYTPKYVTPIDFHSIAGSDATVASLESSTIPVIWTLGPTSGGTEGRQTLYVWPASSGSTEFTIFYASKIYRAWLPETSFFKIPYHFEHVLVWGAAALGAKSLNSGLYPLFKMEYEQALKDMHLVLNWRPDMTPVLRDVVNPYMRSPAFRNMPRWPENISTA